MREFAFQFKKYENDKDNLSLFIWGYVMLMIDFYSEANMTISPEEVEDNSLESAYGGSGIGTWTYFGERGSYPQFAT